VLDLADKYDINLNINDTTKTQGGARGATPAAKSAADTAGFKKLATVIEKTNKTLIKGFINEIDKIFKDFIKKSQGPTIGGQQTTKFIDVNRILRDFSKEMLRTFEKSMSKSKTIPGKGTADPNLGKYYAQLNKSIGNLTNTIDRQLREKTGAGFSDADKKALANILKAAVEKSLPRSTGEAAREVAVASQSLKKIAVEVGNLVKSIKAIRTSGGGIDITEIARFLSSLKALTSESAKVPGEMKRIRDSLKEVTKEQQEIIKSYREALKSIRAGITTQVKVVAQRAQQDPKEFTKVVAKELSNIIGRVPALKGTKVEQLL
jgi:hypothetical protein